MTTTTTTTTLVCGECGRGHYHPCDGDGMYRCNRCGRYIHRLDILPNLDDGESLTVTTAGLAVAL